MKAIKIIGWLFLLFIAVKVCSNEGEKIDYSTRVKAIPGFTQHAYDNTYKFEIAFQNTYQYAIKDIVAEIVISNRSGQVLATLSRDILPSDYKLAPGSTYPYRLWFDSYEIPIISKVRIIYAE
ncbi:MAG: hypothetical protein HRF52_09385 [Ignavibacterium sp.]|jgi:hypothetical protein|uniref:hypothetical protein n=1 Tax=Ignavibacterium sp. TaxID=2651167 RepID=UPI003299493B